LAKAQTQTEPLIRNISDTARWVAVYRARETERPDALFQDPFARRLAGERGEQIAQSMRTLNRADWSFVTRTYLIDQFVSAKVREGVDMVVNLAAGLDARPYRMELPPSLQWVEVDLDEILSYKEEILRSEKPVCSLERIRLDLANVEARRELFAQLGRKAKKALVITEGLVIYLTAEAVGELAKGLAGMPAFGCWVLDIASPALIRMAQKHMARQLNQTPFKFAPEGGPAFFTRFGWKPVDIQSMLRNALRLKRLPLFLRVMALLPEPKEPWRKRPWSGVCLLERAVG
jgi:methyltransferase (TIGR00027 family)